MTARLPKSVLVTGGMGFIGSHLVAALLSLGCEVRVLDNLTTGRVDNISSRVPSLHVVVSDVLEEGALREVVAGVDAVVHLAGLTGVRSQAGAEMMTRVNVTGTQKLLEVCAEAGAKRFVLASSLAVYGEHPPGKVAETQPASDYGRSKLSAERLLESYADKSGAQASALRLANVYGPRMPEHDGGPVMVQFAKSVLRGRPLQVMGDGDQTRDFVHVTDVVRGILKAVEVSPPGFSAFDIGTGRATSVNVLAHLFLRVSGTRLPIRNLPPALELRNSWADTGRASETLGFEAKVALESGVRDLLEWYRRISAPGARLH